MKILNYGSMNIDNVYSVEHMARPGETILATGRGVFCGGKGLNQSIAIAKAGGQVCHAGIVGEDGGMLLDALHAAKVDTACVRTAPPKRILTTCWRASAPAMPSSCKMSCTIPP